MPLVYATEPLMNAGAVVMPGESVDVSPDDVAAILSSGRGTLDAKAAQAAGKQYAAANPAPAK